MSSGSKSTKLGYLLSSVHRDNSPEEFFSTEAEVKSGDMHTLDTARRVETEAAEFFGRILIVIPRIRAFLSRTALQKHSTTTVMFRRRMKNDYVCQLEMQNGGASLYPPWRNLTA
jgi:hypothetical protein